MIRILEDHVVNQIAAGEVVERPASVVKELVENAVDAGATTVTVTLRDGGRERIRVVDDGRGMGRDDAMMCLERHATSKILRAEDLLAVETLGFRGEALPSIAAVSRFTLTTRPADDDVGTRVRVEGGTLRDVAPAGCAPGTSVDVRSLFYNLPARRKFLRSRATELHHCTETVLREALGRPDVDFTVRHEDRELVRAPKAPDRLVRARALLGPQARHLRPVGWSHGPLVVEGLVAPPTVHRSTAAAAVYLYVNGRYVRDTLIRRAVYAAYRGYVPRGRYPLVVLDLRLDPATVDVNVHPTKTEVRFRDPMDVSRALTDGLLDVLGRAGARPAPTEPATAATPLPLRGGAPLFAPTPPATATPAGATPPAPAPPRPIDGPPSVADAPGAEVAVAAHPDDVPLVVAAPGPLVSRPLRALRVVGALAGRFVLCEGDAALVVVDRARAERARLRARIAMERATPPVPSQRLLAPARLQLDRASRDRLLERRDALSALGVDVDAVGPVVVLRSVPTALPTVDPLRLGRAMADAPADADALAEALVAVGAEGPHPELDLYGMRTLLAELDELGVADQVTAEWPLSELAGRFSRR